MKSRHSAALAVYGWLLIVPPLFNSPPSNDPPPVDTDIGAPRSKWDVLERFEKPEDCSRALEAMMMKLRKNELPPFELPAHMSQANINISRANMNTRFSMAGCIDSDSSELKQK
ncbi:MAG TPA: hypothetical protein VMU16_00845 [Candidatus Binataceae bacterium]|nr:hypothetical protein [Candidatus Binataceae bacterium]